MRVFTYSSLFTAVGAAVDNDLDTQQFIFPITLPLIIGIVAMVNAFQNPDRVFEPSLQLVR